MSIVYLRVLIFLMLVVLSGWRHPAIAQQHEETVGNHAGIDIVFCLDLSGSTNGLIDNIREHIWSVVNEAKYLRPGSKVRIGVVGFSRPSFGKTNFYVKTLSKLTEDYDGMVAELWKLHPQVEKGDQFVSNALQAALQLNWSRSPGSVRLLFLIGNGKVNTGSTDYREVVMEILDNGIQLIPVYCFQKKMSAEIEGWNQIGRMLDRECEKIQVMKREYMMKPVPDAGRLREWNRELNRQLVCTSREGCVFLQNVKDCDNKAMIYHQLSFENRLYYRISPHLMDHIAKYDLVRENIDDSSQLYEREFPALDDSLKNITPYALFKKLGAKRKVADETLVSIRNLLPENRQEYIHKVISSDTFETNDVLERVLLKSLYKACVPSGKTIH